MQNIINFVWLRGLLYMKIETGSVICLSELLNLHVGLMDYTNPLQIYKTGWFCGQACKRRGFWFCESWTFNFFYVWYHPLTALIATRLQQQQTRFKLRQRKEQSQHIYSIRGKWARQRVCVYPLWNPYLSGNETLQVLSPCADPGDLMAKGFSFLLKWWISCCDAPIRPGKSMNVHILKRQSPARFVFWMSHVAIGAASPTFKNWLGGWVEGAWPALNHNDGSPSRPLLGSERNSPPLLIFPWVVLSNTTGSSSGLPGNEGSRRAAISKYLPVRGVFWVFLD